MAEPRSDAQGARYMPEQLSLRGIAIGALSIAAAIGFALAAAYAALHLSTEGAPSSFAAHYGNPPPVAGNVELEAHPARADARVHRREAPDARQLRLDRSRARRRAHSDRARDGADSARCRRDRVEMIDARTRLAACAVALLAALSLPGATACAASPAPPVDRVAFAPPPGATLPLDARFIDEHGRRARLGDLVALRPAIIVPAYYGCSNLCTVVLNGVAAGLGASGLVAARDVDVVVVSIDPLETPPVALAKKRAVVGDANGWHFLTGGGREVARFASALGYRYAYDAGERQYAHASGIARGRARRTRRTRALRRGVRTRRVTRCRPRRRRRGRRRRARRDGDSGRRANVAAVLSLRSAHRPLLVRRDERRAQRGPRRAARARRLHRACAPARAPAQGRGR